MQFAKTLMIGALACCMSGGANAQMSQPADANPPEETNSPEEPDLPHTPMPREIAAAGPQGALAGTLIPPAPGHPVVLIIPGSGPTDRDGNNPLGVRAAPYRMLAEGLARRGIGSLRIDKRGQFGSAAAIDDPNAVTVDDYVADIANWIATARQETDVPCVWLAGHSEGGLLALAAAEDDTAGICGLALLMAPGRPFGEVMREQLRANPANALILTEALAIIDALEAGEGVDSAGMHPALANLFAPPVQGFLINVMQYNPAELAANAQLPVLIMAGDEDLQVSQADAEALYAARQDAQFAPPRDTQADTSFRMLPGVNHVFKSVPAGDVAANIASYSDPDMPIAPDVVSAVADFVMTDERSGR